MYNKRCILKYNKAYLIIWIKLSTWGRTGFDGDAEEKKAGSGRHRFNKPELNINANDNLAYAA